MKTHITLWIRSIALCGLAAALMLTAGGCASLGSRRVSPDQFNYNEAISRSTQEQLLLNLVRLRFFEIPVFLSVSSVLTQYSYTGGVGISGSGLFNSSRSVEASGSVEGSGSLEYSERPTITYLPIEGQEFAKRMLSPIPVNIIFALGQSGWPVDDLMLISLQRINRVENMSFGALPPPGDLERTRQMERDIERFENFRKIITLMLKMFDSNLLELQHRQIDEENGPQTESSTYLVLAEAGTDDEQRLTSEFRTTLGLDPKTSEFRVTERLTGRDPDEITIQTRSLLAVMSFCSRGVQVPERVRNAGWVIGWEEAAEAWEARFGESGYKIPFPFNTQTGDARPADAFVAVKSHGSWFFIDNTDIMSKRVFNLLALLFRLLAPGGQGEAPVLTLPTGP